MAESKAASVGGLFHFRAAIVTGHTQPRGAFELGWRDVPGPNAPPA
jgi:hypothetical protein